LSLAWSLTYWQSSVDRVRFSSNSISIYIPLNGISGEISPCRSLEAWQSAYPASRAFRGPIPMVLVSKASPFQHGWIAATFFSFFHCSKTFSAGDTASCQFCSNYIHLERVVTSETQIQPLA
jgi:hypothetical protein